MEKIISLSTKKYVYTRFVHFIIILFLLIFWFFASIINTSKYGITSLINEYDKNHFINFNSNEILRSQKLIAKFKANDRNLGIVAVRFNTFNRINSDRILFRIREAGEEEWHYENNYKVDQFQPNDFFTFGFNPIISSENKIFEYELVSLSGKHKDAVALSNIEPVFLTVHSYTRNELLSNPFYLLRFVFNKIIYLFNDVSTTFTTLIYLLPLLIYLLIIYIFKKIKNYLPVIGIYVLSLFGYIVLVNEVNVLVGYVFFLLWFAIVYRYFLESRISYLFAIIFLFLSLIFLVFGDPFKAERAALVFFNFFVIGFFVSLVELRKKRKNIVTLEEFICRLYKKRRR